MAEVKNHSGGAMVSMLTSSAVDRGFEPRSNQTEDYVSEWLLFIKLIFNEMMIRSALY
jgi:hypothetical protein